MSLEAPRVGLHQSLCPLDWLQGSTPILRTYSTLRPSRPIYPETRGSDPNPNHSPNHLFQDCLVLGKRKASVVFVFVGWHQPEIRVGVTRYSQTPLSCLASKQLPSCQASNFSRIPRASFTSPAVFGLEQKPQGKGRQVVLRLAALIWGVVKRHVETDTLSLGGATLLCGHPTLHVGLMKQTKTMRGSHF